eukprot:TRINITY_DN1462_c0_g1_i3.p1 TRINITY_DN1462_c0_g1~~TRINITY_DN1462_c0_g1_i3.p1  ORF type:complete len:71 (-),score=9.96 TRINITY_DN1462_c0_g1_i3:29-241(-)
MYPPAGDNPSHEPSSSAPYVSGVGVPKSQVHRPDAPAVIPSPAPSPSSQFQKKAIEKRKSTELDVGPTTY